MLLRQLSPAFAAAAFDVALPRHIIAIFRLRRHDAMPPCLMIHAGLLPDADIFRFMLMLMLLPYALLCYAYTLLSPRLLIFATCRRQLMRHAAPYFILRR